MKKLTINVYFEGREKNLSKTFNISDEMFDFLMIPFKRWSEEMESYMGDREDRFYDALYTIQDIILSGFILKKFGIDEYSIENQGVFPHDLEFDILVEK